MHEQRCIPELKHNHSQSGHLFLQIREIKVQKLIIILQVENINVQKQKSKMYLRIRTLYISKFNRAVEKKQVTGAKKQTDIGKMQIDRAKKLNSVA